jgi:hypothetical protein
LNHGAEGAHLVLRWACYPTYSFAILYIIGINTFLCVGLIVVLGTGLFIQVYKISNKYGEYGMMKKVARRGIPDVVKSHSRNIFFKKEK